MKDSALTNCKETNHPALFVAKSDYERQLSELLEEEQKYFLLMEAPTIQQSLSNQSEIRRGSQKDGINEP